MTIQLSAQESDNLTHVVQKMAQAEGVSTPDSAAKHVLDVESLQRQIHQLNEIVESVASVLVRVINEPDQA